MKYCTKCGEPIELGLKFCTNCGNSIKNEDEIEGNKASEPVIEKSVIESIKDTEKDKASDQKVGTAISEKPIKENQETKPDEILEQSKARKEERNNKNFENNIVSQNSGRRGNSRPLLGIITKVIIGILVISAILGGIFFNKIRGQYYIYKYNNSILVSEKIDYATKALEASSSTKSKDLIKESLLELAKTDINSAESKLQELSKLLSQGEYQSIASDIKKKKIDKLYSDGKYNEAAKEFEEIDKLGGDFKANSNYEDIMLNIAADLTGSAKASSKDILLKNDNVYFDNFDQDNFDEIIQLDKNGYYDSSELKMNLYKYKNGQYKLADTYTIESAWDSKIQGIYNYEKNKKGIYVSYANAATSVGTAVFGVTDGKIKLKGAVFSNNYTRPEDADKDGVYEVLSNSVSVFDTSGKGTSKWYKIYDDGRTPTEVKPSTDSSNSSAANGDYIFPDSDKTFLKESDLESLSKDKLALARNEIFARHGFVFKSDEFKKYFEAKSWYKPDPNYDGSDSALNQYEIANYKIIQQMEKK